MCSWQFDKDAVLVLQGDALSGDEAVKLVSACADAKGRVQYERFAGKLQ